MIEFEASHKGDAPPEAMMAADPYRLVQPAQVGAAAVFSSPHSGRAYFHEFLQSSKLRMHTLRASEDAYVDRLFDAAPTYGAPLLSAVAPRAYLDLNRDPRDLDPHLITGVSSAPTNARVMAGLGVAPRVVAEGVPIYDHKLSLSDVRERLERWHAPYHAELAALLLSARRRFGHALLIDCHSMPSEGNGAAKRAREKTDVILGDRFGFSAEPELTDAVQARFEEAGFSVARNAPFAGGFITERHGRPSLGVSAIQIEIDRSLYLDEERIEPSSNFQDLRSRLRVVIRDICNIAGSTVSWAPFAAE